MAEIHLEREAKYDVGAGFVMPDLSFALPPGGGSVDIATHTLRSEYLDTADGALQGARMTLRRRTGGSDDGWHLKVPRSAAREEIRSPLESQLPAELRALLRGVIGDAALHPVAIVETARTAHQLRDSADALLVEVADDAVHATALGPVARISEWREIEVELGGGDEGLLAAVGARLRDGGARDSSSGSKLSRALGAESTSKRHPGAEGPVWDYLRTSHRQMLAGDVALRRGDDSVVHKFRVAIRRIRSTLRTFGPLFDPSAANLDVELRWCAGLLGELRDRQVLRARLAAAIQELPGELVVGSAAERVDAALAGEQDEARAALHAELAGERYLAVLAELSRVLATPPPARAATWLAKRTSQAERKVERRLERARKSGRAEDLHGARKAAKRARYALELVAGAGVVKAAHRGTKKYRKLQDRLGEFQDSQVSQSVLLRLGAAAEPSSFTLGVLLQRERDLAERIRRRARSG